MSPDASDLLERARAYIGVRSQPVTACDRVEAGAVRRYAQAIQDENPIYSPEGPHHPAYGAPVAPPLYPVHIFRRELGTADPLQEHAQDPDYDGSMGSLNLPEIEPLRGHALLNGGIEFEFLRHALHGDSVTVVSRYADVRRKDSSKGVMFIVEVESEFVNGQGQPLIRTRRSYIRRK